MNTDYPDFPFEKERCLQAIRYLLSHRPMTAVQVAILLFASEKYHLTTFGLPCFGGRFIATELGPMSLDGFILAISECERLAIK